MWNPATTGWNSSETGAHSCGADETDPPVSRCRQLQASPGPTAIVDRQRLVEKLEAEFGGNDTAIRAVARQAGDLADSGRLVADAGYELTAGTVVEHLQDAPAEYTLVERWNWWIGSLALAYGESYRRFRVRTDID